MILLGRLLAVNGGADSRFIGKLNEYVYKWLIPSVLFMSVYNADIDSDFDPELLAFCAAGTLAVFFGAWFISARMLKRSQVAAFTQACFRSNYNLMAIPLMSGLVGEENLAKALVMSPVFVALYSISSVVILTIYSGDRDKSWLKRIGDILIGIIKNPFITFTLAGLAINLLGITLPVIVLKPAKYICDMATPAALIGLGGALSAGSLTNNLRPALVAASVKTIISPIVMIPAAIFLGFRGINLGVIAVLFSTPVAVNAYSTARALGGDAELTSSAILLSTVMSVISLVITMTSLVSAGLV